MFLCFSRASPRVEAHLPADARRSTKDKPRTGYLNSNRNVFSIVGVAPYWRPVATAVCRGCRRPAIR